MKTYPIKSVTTSIIPVGSRAGLPCKVIEIRNGCEPLTLGQVIERLSVEPMDEVLIVGDEPIPLLDFEFYCALRNHKYTTTIVTNGRHELKFGFGMVDHVIVRPIGDDLKIESAHDLILTTRNKDAYKHEDFEDFNYDHGFIEVLDVMTISISGLNTLKNKFPGWKFCADISERYEGRA